MSDKKAVGYVRRSTDRQAKSIEDQRAEIMKYSEAHGYRIVRWFSDDAISGDLTEKREAYQQMIQAAQSPARPFEAILAYDQSRLGRSDIFEFGFYMHTLRLAGVKVHFVAENIPEGDHSQLLAAVGQGQKHMLLKQISKDTLRGQISNLEQGYEAGRQAPYGYDLAILSRDGRPLRIVRRVSVSKRRDELGNLLPPERQQPPIYQVLTPGGKLVETVEGAFPRNEGEHTRLVPGDPDRQAVVREIFRMRGGGEAGVP